MGKRGPMSPETKAHWLEARRQTMIERYGDPHYNNMAKNRQTKLDRYGDASYNNMEKNKATCLERYGFEHHNQNPEIAQRISDTKKTPETQAKYEATVLERYGVKNPNLCPEIRQKYTDTLLAHYGVTNPLKNKEIFEKREATMRANKSFNKSKPEELMLKELTEKYGADGIKTQYNKDPRYPFHCDFYIPSEDLFIELNAHPSHGGHPFNPDDPNDMMLLEKLRKDNSEWSNMIIDVWSVRDLKKRKCAEENNLNYIAIYPD